VNRRQKAEDEKSLDRNLNRLLCERNQLPFAKKHLQFAKNYWNENALSSARVVSELRTLERTAYCRSLLLTAH